MSEELKPCPLCGGEVRIYRRTDGQVDGIVCDECLLTLEAVDVCPEWHTLDELVLRWNARAERTCRMTHVLLFEEYAVDGIECDECGWIDVHDLDKPMPERCPGCGAKVVG